MAKVADRYLEIDPWYVIEKGFSSDRSRVSESIFSLGNEYMGVRGYFDEGYSGDRLVGCYLNGVYEKIVYPPAGYKGIASGSSFMVNTLDWLYTRLTLDGETLDLSKCKTTDFIRILDLKSGTVSREFIWHTASGKSIKLKFIRFLSMVDSNLGCQKVIFEPVNFSGSIEVKSGLDFTPIHELQEMNFWNCPKRGQENGLTAIVGKTNNSGHQVFSGFRLNIEAVEGTKQVEDEKFIGVSFSMNLNEGKSACFEKLVVNYADKKPNTNTDIVWAQGMKLAEELTSESFEEALQKHKAYWEDVWNTLDITIDGDPANQQGIRFCIFQLHQTYHGFDPANNIGAKGLTGEGYSGHTFWDTETYCLPFYIFNNPRAARNLLEYRYKTMPQAMEWAKIQDSKGAFYPMATLDGTESCGVWWHANLEIHVSGAISYGIWNYVRLSGDKDFLYNQGIEMLIQICRFFESRGNWSPSGEYGLYGVMGPDEFHTFVNNNCYTNVLVKNMLEYTLGVIEEMKAVAQDKLSLIMNKTGLKAEEQASWKAMADKMIILYDNNTGLYEQHEGYFKLPRLDVNSIPVEEFPLYNNWSLPRIYRYDMTKQPDVLLFMFFFSQDYSLETKFKNFEYYEPRCIHESSLSPSVHSILAAEVGKHEQAYDFFKFATRLDLDNYNRNTREGLHTTSIAAAWMNIVYGFGGMRSDGEQLVFRPSIPKQWNSFSYKVLFNDSVLSVFVNKEEVKFKVVTGTAIPVRVFGNDYLIGSEAVSIAMPEDRIA